MGLPRPMQVVDFQGPAKIGHSIVAAVGGRHGESARTPWLSAMLTAGL